MRSLRREDDRGVTLIMVAIMIVALFTIVAIVIDLGAVRSQRRQGQLAVDSSASAAGIALAESNAVAACQDALGYLTLNLSIPAFTGTSCATFAAACVDTTERTTTGTSREYTVTLVHPVTNGSPTGVLKGSAISSPTQTPTADDGAPCDRFGVKIDIKGQKYFSGVVGLGANKTSVHAVARVRSGNSETRPLNLLILDRTACQTIDVGGLAQLIVRAPFDLDTGEFTVGTAAADSDGSTCNGQKAIVEASGNNSLLRADGPCPSDPTTECTATGSIDIFGSSGLTDGSCIGTAEIPTCRGFDDASIQPNASASLGRFTRSPIDYRYNCKASYTSEPWYSTQDIPGCTDPANGNYIDVLKAHASSITNAATASAQGYIRISGGACMNNGVTPPYPPGNYFVDCNDFRLNGGSVVFQGGNIIFKNDVTLTSSASLRINTCPPAPAPSCGAVTWTTGTPFTAASAKQSSRDAAWVYLNGAMSKSAQATLAFNNMMIVIPPTGNGIDLTGGSGQLTWTAPNLPTWAFDDLALWSDSTVQVGFSGQSVLFLEGVFFVPRATISYAGTGTQQQADAQFIGNKLSVTGQGTLAVVPAPNRAVEFPTDPTSGLIR